MRITSSSTSSSEAATASPWRGFSATLVAAAAVACGLLVIGLSVLDPYDSGRALSIGKPGVAPQGPRTANASRGRDPAFDAAIIGNSHVQLLSPERLDAATGARFVSLIVPATYPREQLLVLDWFLRHRPAPRALVLGIDTNWCRADASFHEKPFPFWLYGRSGLDYWRGLASYSVLEAIPGRIAALRKPETRARRDGYWDYEADYLRIGYGDMNHVRAKLAGERPTQGAIPDRFGAADALKGVLATLAPQTRVVLVHPPRYISFVPEPGSAAAKQDEACRAAYRTLAASRPNTAIVDWSGDRPDNRIPENFFDKTHYRHPVARAIERDVAGAIR